MRNSIRIWPKIDGRMIEAEYVVEGEWQEAFARDTNPQWVKFSGGDWGFRCEYNQDVGGVPEGIAVIPFLANVMPMAWLYDADVFVDEVDLAFYQSMADVRGAYARMYPKLKFGGNLIARRPTENFIRQPKAPPLVLYSGGVDALFSLLGNRALRPTLLTIWGSDVFFDDAVGWNKVSGLNGKVAADFGASYDTIRSSFRFFQHYPTLDRLVKPLVGDNWWHGFQHGIGLLGLTAPLAWARKTGTVFISSSYSSKDRQFTCCASHPSIDTALRFFDGACQHYDFTVTRQEKVAYICEESSRRRQDIPLRVCWTSTVGDNCCVCDKCMRTIFAIHAEGADPRRFGFELRDETIDGIVASIAAGKVARTSYWHDIIAKLKDRGLPRERHVAAILELFASA